MKNIVKKYPGVVANDDVSIEAERGSVLCLIGENGAGKSTLMNILYGMEQPDSGEILLNGKPVRFRSSYDAMRSGIGMVFQHFMIVKEMSCLDNIILGMEPRCGLKTDYKKARKEIEELQKMYGMDFPLDAQAGSIWVGLQEKLEITKTIYHGADIIILDEPTAVLTPQETEEFFENIQKLSRMGKTIVFITHKLDEVMRVADDIVVMRQGHVVKKIKKKETNINELTVCMVGHELPPIREREETDPQARLVLDDVSIYNEQGLAVLKNVSVELKKGEILGIAGVAGNGQVELASAVTGLKKVNSGTIYLDGKDITKEGRHGRIEKGISYIPEDRNAMGGCLDWSVENNSIAGYHRRKPYCGRNGFLNREAIKKTADEFIKTFSIKTPNGKTQLKVLSGGNCQKVIVARETSFGQKVIVASEPSRGVDIGTINVIQSHLMDLRNQGAAILFISSSLDEIIAISDRIAVMYEGEITAILDPRKTTRMEIGLYMSGAKRG